MVDSRSPWHARARAGGWSGDRRRSWSYALVAAWLACASLVPLPTTADASPPPGQPTSLSGRAIPETDGLAVTIDRLNPSFLPQRGSIRVKGKVTNVDDQTWSEINLYSFLGDDFEPMTTAAELSAALEINESEYFGERITNLGEPGRVEELAPGESARYRLTVPVEAFTVTEQGIYWFGVHALGTGSEDGRDTFADGRARTFLPFMRPRRAEVVPAALVVPVRRALLFSPDGSLSDLTRWEEALAGTGRFARIGRLPELGDAADGEPLTFVVDPAMLDAVDRLARDNPPRSLAATESPEPTEDDQEPPTRDAPDPSTPLGETAAAWLDDFRSSLDGHEVMALPYGNPDVSAVLRHDPGLLDLAVAQSSRVLTEWGVDTTPVLTSPAGHLDAEALSAVPDGGMALVSDRALDRNDSSLVQFGDSTVAAWSSGFAEGGPGPDRQFSTVNLRQRLLAETAIRSLGDGEPVVAALPPSWDLANSSHFMSGLDVPWVELETMSELRTSDPIRPALTTDQIRYGERHRGREIQADVFPLVDRLIARGDLLQSLLADNNEVGADITDEALTAVSYSLRNVNAASRAALGGSQNWITGELSKVEIRAPEGITLSGESGSFSITISNGLDQPVSVGVVGQQEPGLEVEPLEPVVLAANSSATQFVNARVTDNRVHNVTLELTEGDGSPIGSSDTVPIRATQVSDVIWAIMGSGAGLLFIAIAIRLIRRARGTSSGEQPEPAP